MAVKKIPKKLRKQFTMDGLVDIEYKYRDDSSAAIQREILSKYTPQSFAQLSYMVQKKQTYYYGTTDHWMYSAFEKFPISGKDVCVFGSACPWYEVICVEYGVKMCHVLEYSPRQSFHEKIKYCSPDEMIKYDAALSISSFEHYGLGRYGDPINPDGDLEAMQQARDLLKDNGILYLSVPIGKDRVCFNVHRIYGKHRFSKLIEGFELIDSFGFDSFDRTDNNANGTSYQPVFILKK